MIISHRHKFIFIKTNKTAGTSIEIALSRFCGPDDIITPISAEDEKTRSALGYRGPQNNPRAPFLDYRFRDWRKLVSEGKRKHRFYNHMSAGEIRRHVDPATWNGYYKFCVERNPWDRIISLYWWSQKSEPRPTVDEFLASRYPKRLKRRGRDLYTINGQVVVDTICRFENLSDEMERIATRLGLPDRIELPHAKGNYRKDRRSYREILNAAQRDQVATMFRDEIDLLGYQF